MQLVPSQSDMILESLKLLRHCDLVYAAENTRFQLPFTLGVCPEAGSSLLLPTSSGIKKSAEVLMLGDFFDTAKALDLGL